MNRPLARVLGLGLGLALALGATSARSANVTIDFTSNVVLTGDGLIDQIPPVTFSRHLYTHPDGFIQDSSGAYNFYGENDELMTFASPTKLVSVDITMPFAGLPQPTLLHLRAYDASDVLIEEIYILPNFGLLTVPINKAAIAKLVFHFDGGDTAFYGDGRPHAWYYLDNLVYDDAGCSADSECPMGSPVCLANGQCGHCSAVVACPDVDPCHLGVCDTSTGTCSNPISADGSACDDGDACTAMDSCQADTCLGTPVTCAALDSCHAAGTCDVATGCSNPALADGTACDDGNACLTDSTCGGGVCGGGTPVACTAQDECHTAGTCDPSSGACSNPSQPDGTVCSTGTCQAGVCINSGAGGASAGGSSAGGSSAGGAGTGGDSNAAGGAANGAGGGGATDTGTDDGCGCRVEGATDDAWGRAFGAVLATFALALRARRRRSSAERSRTER